MISVALSRALADLVRDGDLRARLGTTAARRVAKGFRREVIWECLEALYSAPRPARIDELPQRQFKKL